MSREQELEEKQGLLSSSSSLDSSHSLNSPIPLKQYEATANAPKIRRCRTKSLFIVVAAALVLLGAGLLGLHQSGAVDSHQLEADVTQQITQWSSNVKTWFGSSSNATIEQEAQPEALVVANYTKEEESSAQSYQVDPSLEQEAKEAESPAGVSQIFKDFAPNNIVNTLPPLPQELLVSPGNATDRYLAYLPHSGLYGPLFESPKLWSVADCLSCSHNQRGILTNAATLAHLLNRTLITPHARLGRPIPWATKAALEEKQSLMQKSKLNSRCRPFLPVLENSTVPFTGPGVCRDFHKSTEMTYSLMSNLSTMVEGTRLLPRDDLDPAWFTRSVEEGGLGLTEDDIFSIPDPDRYSWRIYDDASDPDANGKFTHRMNLEELTSGPAADKRLIYFGSLYSGVRLKLSKPEARRIFQQTVRSLTFRNPLLDSIAKDIGHRLGGRDNYVGLHLRVGDGAFRVNAGRNMRNSWNLACTLAFGLSEETCTSLANQNGNFESQSSRSRMHHRRASERDVHLLDRSPFAETDDLQLHDLASYVSSSAYLEKRSLGPREQIEPQPGYTTLEDMQMADSLQCQRPLYTDPNLVPLNRPVYIATDSRLPREDPNLQVFFKSFPCVFVLSDFIEATQYNSHPLPDLSALFELRTELDGVKVAQFLLAFLEAEVASRSLIATLGTEGSTFSSFARTTLHNAYAQDADDLGEDYY